MGLVDKLKKNARNVVLTAGLVGVLASCNDSGNGIVPPVCSVNPAVSLAQEYNLPQSMVNNLAVLGSDCVVDSDESDLITKLLPGIIQRSNEVIANSYFERFVSDDNRFQNVENVTMSRFFEGRNDREGLQVHPGYFELNDNGFVQIPNAYFMSIFEMPFRFEIFPPNDSGSKGEPIVSDNMLVSHYLVFNQGRALEGGDQFTEGYSWFERPSGLIVPQPDLCVTDFNYSSMQVVFTNNLYSFPIPEVVNPLQVPARITNIGYIVNANNNRNAYVTLEPVDWSASLGHPNLFVSLSHLDDEEIEASGLSVGDIIPIEGRIGRLDPNFTEWRIIVGFYSDEGYQHEGITARVIDILNPEPHNPERRGLVWGHGYHESVNDNGTPNIINVGVHNSVCQYGENWGRHPSVSPMTYTFPIDTRDK